MSEWKHEVLVQKEWEAHGLLCRAVRNNMGNNNGYTRVLKGHPFYDVGYSKEISIKPNKARLKDNVDEVGFGGMIAALSGTADQWMRSPEGYIKVHGGLTYASHHCPGGKGKMDPNSWWFGFDTAHMDDYVPFDLRLKSSTLEVDARFPDLFGPNHIEKWTAYINRVRAGEMQRDLPYEADLDKKHYWTVEDVAAEVEKMAEQLAMIQLLGVSTEKE